jgi:hypothetical protein
MKTLFTLSFILLFGGALNAQSTIQIPTFTQYSALVSITGYSNLESVTYTFTFYDGETALPTQESAFTYMKGTDMKAKGLAFEKFFDTNLSHVLYEMNKQSFYMTLYQTIGANTYIYAFEKR